MKKNFKKLQLKKTVVLMLGSNEKHYLNGGAQAATKPWFTCPITCGPTWLCPPPVDETTACI